MDTEESRRKYGTPWVAEPWKDGSTPEGQLNIFSPSFEVCIAEGILDDVALHIVRCVNAFGSDTPPTAFTESKSYKDAVEMAGKSLAQDIVDEMNKYPTKNLFAPPTATEEM